MAGPTIIDQLIVTLGLRPQDFTRGTKQAAAAQLELEQTTRRSAERSSGYIGKLSAKWLSVAGAIYAVKKAVTIIDDVAERTRQLGIASENYGLAAHNLRNFENAVEMMGGSADEARRTVGGFSKAIFDLAYRGEMSDSLIMLARLGVQFQTASGGARNFNDILLDTADAIEKAQAQGMRREDAFQYLQTAGFDSGTAQLLLAGRQRAEAELQAQAERRQVTAQDIRTATGIRRASIGKDQTLHGVAIAGMDAAGGLQKGVNDLIDHLARPGGVNESLDGLARSSKRLMDSFDQWTVNAAHTTRGMRNNNPLNLRAVGNQNADRQGFRVFGTMEEGILAANEQLDRYAAKGVNTIEKIISTWAPPNENDTKAYIDEMVKETGMSADQIIEQGHRAILLAAMAKHESGKPGVITPDSGAIADVLQSNASPTPYAGRATPTPGAQTINNNTSHTTTVDIGQITLHTQARDADKLARDLDGAVRRKLLTSHAEQGLQ